MIEYTVKVEAHDTKQFDSTLKYYASVFEDVNQAINLFNASKLFADSLVDDFVRFTYSAWMKQDYRVKTRTSGTVALDSGEDCFYSVAVLDDKGGEVYHVIVTVELSIFEL